MTAARHKGHSGFSPHHCTHDEDMDGFVVEIMKSPLLIISFRVLLGVHECKIK